MASKQELLEQMVSPVATALGCELWGLEYLTQGRYTTVRIFIDGPNGVSLDDCERVSRQVSSVFDVEDPIDGEYTLEVSSPGMDRPLYKESQYLRYVGETISVRMRIARDGRRPGDRAGFCRIKGRCLAPNAEIHFLQHVFGQLALGRQPVARRQSASLNIAG